MREADDGAGEGAALPCSPAAAAVAAAVAAVVVVDVVVVVLAVFCSAMGLRGRLPLLFPLLESLLPVGCATV